MIDLFEKIPTTGFSYQQIKFTSFLNKIGPIHSVYETGVKSNAAGVFGDRGNPIFNCLRDSRFSKIILHEEEDEFFRVKYRILTVDGQGENASDLIPGIGRITIFEQLQGCFNMRFFYDGQVVVVREPDKSQAEVVAGNGPDSSPIRILRHGFGRYTDQSEHKFSLGFWKHDLPFGKQVVYKK